MDVISAAERELDVLRVQKDRIRNRQLEAIRRSFISCPKCHKESRLSNWTFIQIKWYTPPSGCTEGDYWNTSETKFCYLVCPKCGIESYVYVHPQKNKIVRLVDKSSFTTAQLFKTVIVRETRPLG
ncbi:MAG: hypothetical protein UW46_C0007G0017 [Candidatus Yanofskybacteria bacterium GW2011_GWF1_44_227]|uniref:Uncharacterized protein n=1 Tax=Candidatus Yanofskybacteria bacterium GW2011_GWE2_40_11 TaxID=1619033 RepID=A0A0G0QIL4_9BACT|nr:MAG: hypothetical protein UT75_C0011G0016 [Candidatus Yanofskybacteria bacterium GW2011_GWE2_40_11]KKT15357.1 MAG: hypothetical protein UV97_C0008G0006 [Candidatus Yanofskybacteria bacterium GW2011_GWF2_43_596]KKT53041.1 MAG: hypothetical protein UW46_C0007G0017 [Candidatus Yanofskybacteria bacterium GW2011_GWF1_44_227]OGN35761.1 MAG: hypothetical protein A2207_01670 [Candidatus Yanofskybacteria bacterium RIFOXYA1_FULL_44_17]OGN37090.1 MAG: hypothetical protein A2371_01190 [Candidatus Yanofs